LLNNEVILKIKGKTKNDFAFFYGAGFSCVAPALPAAGTCAFGHWSTNFL
jgi:hypothetical protein